jgi:hypothetical protein
MLIMDLILLVLIDMPYCCGSNYKKYSTLRFMGGGGGQQCWSFSTDIKLYYLDSQIYEV